MISVLDRFSRYIVHWEIRETMTERDVEIVLARALEKHPGVQPRFICDSGPQFIAKDFKEFIRTYNLTHVRTSPYDPQSHAKLERWHGSIQHECIRLTCPATKQEAEIRVERCVHHYHHVRLHSALGYIAPAECLAGVSQVIAQERDRKLEESMQRRLEKACSKTWLFRSNKQAITKQLARRIGPCWGATRAPRFLFSFELAKNTVKKVRRGS